MTNLKGLFSSSNPNWETPQYLFNYLQSLFSFTLDVCASDTNHKCDRYFTLKEDGLKQSWQGETCFMNPPYGKVIPRWMQKAHEECQQENTIIVALVPARTDTNWWWNSCIHHRIWFLKGRLRFEINGRVPQGKDNPAFPSALILFGYPMGVEWLDVIGAAKEYQMPGHQVSIDRFLTSPDQT